MKRTAKWAGIGAACGLVIVTIFAVGEMLGSPGHPETAVVIILALAMGGLLVGVPAGAALGAVAALLTRGTNWVGLRGGATPQAASAAPASPRSMGGPSRKAMAALDTVRTRAREGAPQAIRAAREAARQQPVSAQPQPVPLAPVRRPSPPPPTPLVDTSDPERVNRIIAEIAGMPGLEHVADQVADLAETVRGNERRRAAGLAVAETGLHLAFVGPPGTAKSTVARAWGRALCATGLLPTDKVVVAKREDLVAGVIGGTAPKTSEVIDRTLGGVLFIDEAYSLAAPTGGGGPDFGAEAIETLLARMEEDRGKFAVIAAGYPADMERLLASNAGLRSRFEETVEFRAYDGPTLVRVAQVIAAAADYEWDDEAMDVLRSAFARLAAAPPPGWANGRSVRQIIGAAAKAQHRRLGEADPSRTLTVEDAKAALARLYPEAV